MLTLKERQALTTGSKLVDANGREWTVSRFTKGTGPKRAGAMLWTRDPNGEDFFSNGELRRWFSVKA